MEIKPIARTMVSYVPSQRLLWLRRLGDLPRRLRKVPHEADYQAFHGFRTAATVVDVGANRGQAIESVRVSLDDPAIIAFEPNPHLARYLTKRFPDVVVHPVALGGETSSTVLYIPRYGNTWWDTRASLSADRASAAFDRTDFWRFNRARAAVEPVPVQIETLDSFDLAPTLIKVDTEGTEESVIAGGRSTIETHRPVILGEGRLAGAAEALSPLGYRAYRFEAGRRTFVADRAGDINTFLMCPHHLELFEGIDVVG